MSEGEMEPTQIRPELAPTGKQGDFEPLRDVSDATLVRPEQLLQIVAMNAISDERAPAGYQIERELGRGGMGVVYLARELRLQRVCALKMLLASDYVEPQALERFQSEARAVARLQHPGIIQIFEIGVHHGKPFMALEFCAGGSLDTLLREHPFPPTQAAQIMQSLARAMHFAHQAHIVHRDLKPANILFDAQQQPRITDFGIAKKLDEASITNTGAIIGTPSYMPPEQARGQLVGPRADVYSLGAILYEMLTARAPFRAATAMSTLYQVCHEEVVAPRQLNSQVPLDLQTICLKCLQKDPSRRYASAEALADDLARFLEGKPILARAVGPIERSVKWIRRNQRLALAIALAVFTLLVGSGVSLWQAMRATRAEQATKEALSVAQARLDDVLSAYGQMVFDIQTKLENRSGTRQLRHALLSQARDRLQELVDQTPNTSRKDNTLVTAYLRLGDVALELGEPAVAERRYREAKELTEEMAQGNPNDHKAHRNRMVAANRLGDVLLKRGAIAEATELFREAHDLTQQLLQIKPEDPEAQIDLLVVYRKLADAANNLEQLTEKLRYHRLGLDAAQVLSKKQPKLVEAKAWLARHAEYAARCLLQQNKRQEANELLQQSLRLRRELTQQDAQHRGWQTELATLYLTLGEELRIQGRLSDAAEHYRNAREIFEKLLRADPEDAKVESEFTNASERLGSMLLLSGQPQKALPYFQEVLRIRQSLAEKSGNSESKVSVAIACNHLGDVTRQLGQRNDAVKHYLQVVQLAQEIIKNAPKAVFARRLLATAYNNLGEVHQGLGKLPAALEYHTQSLQLRQALAQSAKDNIEAQTDWMISLFHLATVEKLAHRYERGSEWAKKGLQLAQSLAKEKKLPPYQAVWPQFLEELQQECQLAMSVSRNEDALFALKPEWIAKLAPLRVSFLLHKGQLTDAAHTARRYGDWAAGQKALRNAARYDAACSLALCAAKDDSNRQKLIGECVALLSKARDEGYFDAAKITHLKQDADFDAIRATTQFLEFLATLEKK